MMSVSIVCIGKLKEKYLRDGCDEYLKRLSAFCKIQVIELNEEKIKDNPSEKEIELVIKKEGKKVLEVIQKNAYVISMCIEGKQLSSNEFAAKISSLAILGKSSLSLIIGGSFGLSDDVKNRSDFKLSMSPMTFPHQLARMLLLEQLYRGFSINNNSKYHK